MNKQRFDIVDAVMCNLDVPVHHLVTRHPTCDVVFVRRPDNVPCVALLVYDDSCRVFVFDPTYVVEPDNMTHDVIYDPQAFIVKRITL